MADSTQQTPASEHDGFIYGLESFVFDGKELGLISNGRSGLGRRRTVDE